MWVGACRTTTVTLYRATVSGIRSRHRARLARKSRRRYRGDGQSQWRQFRERTIELAHQYLSGRREPHLILTSQNALRVAESGEDLRPRQFQAVSTPWALGRPSGLCPREPMCLRHGKSCLKNDTGSEDELTPRHKAAPSGVLTSVARELAVRMTADAASEAAADLDSLFRAQFARISRVIARVTRDPSRAEELAVDVFLKWSGTPNAHGPQAIGWLYRTAMRVGLNELRSETRRHWYERLFGLVPAGRSAVATPEDERHAAELREHVRAVLGSMRRRQAALLILRSDGLSYAEIAAALSLNAASIGTLLARAEAVFQKEYIKHYGTE